MGVSLSVAAILGMLLAPRPTVHSPVDGLHAPSENRLSRKLSGFKKLIGSFFPQAAEYIPDAQAPAEVTPDPDMSHDEPTPPPADRPKKRRSAAAGFLAWP